MNLATLEAIEQEVRDRGYRVRFRNGTEDYQYLPDLDEHGAPEPDGDVQEWAQRLMRIAAFKALHEIVIVGPDLAPVDPGRYEAVAALALEDTHSTEAPRPTRVFGKAAKGMDIPLGPPAEDDEPEPEPVDPDRRLAVDGIPLAGGTVLAEQDDICLVGDSNSQVYVCPKEALDGVPGISWRPKIKRFETVIMGPGSDGRGEGAHIPWLTWTSEQGVSARAAFHSPSGMWFVRR